MSRRTAALLVALSACSGRGERQSVPEPGASDAATAAAVTAPLEQDVDRTLASGLRLRLHPAPGTGAVALLVLFRIGSDHDPAGQSGLAHLIEHLLVTAAAGDRPARPAEEWMRRYPSGWNAQTGGDYTVVATVFPPAQLEAELGEAIARMIDLRVHPDDLAREVPRLFAELGAMFDTGALGAANRARERARPAPHRGRKGGVPAELRALTLEQAVARWRALYRGGNTIVVVAGELDAGAPDRLAARLAAVPAGDPPPPRPPGGPPAGDIDRFDPTGAGPTIGCAAYPALRPDAAGYPQLLVAAGRLLRAAGSTGAGAGVPPVRFAPLDEPEVITLCATGRINDLPERLIARLDGQAAAALAAPVAPGDIGFAERAFGPILGLPGSPGPPGPQGLYTRAFTSARAVQLGIDPAALQAGLRAVTDLATVRTEVFAPRRRGAAVAVGE